MIDPKEIKGLNDLTGRRFGKLTVISLDRKDNKNYFWMCACDCGKKSVVRGRNLKSGKTRSCGCLRVSAGRTFRLKDLTGKTFGHWFVESCGNTHKGHIYWNCVCVCGRHSKISGSSLTTGNSLSCGCIRRKVIRDMKEKINEDKSSEAC